LLCINYGRDNVSGIYYGEQLTGWLDFVEANLDWEKYIGTLHIDSKERFIPQVRERDFRTYV